ncbi:MAG TPA: diguanylate cyclase, partial [Chloroflexia bacterium]|nr:diguanylate cyclase [Chloroflexia bacterium]
ACRTAEEAYTVVAQVAPRLFPNDAGALLVMSESRNSVDSVVVWGMSLPTNTLFGPDDCWALRREHLHLVDDTANGLLCPHLQTPLPGTYMCVPMIVQGQAIGVLHLSQAGTASFSEAKQHLAATVAEHIALALANLELQETLRSQSIRDPLTDLFNRRYMEESLEREMRRAVRNRSSLGIIMLDLDHFKVINDTYGHDAGDAVLRELGSLLQNNIRGEDIACRYGGEEFTLILPDVTLQDVTKRARELNEAIARLKVPYRNFILGSLTASQGVAIFPTHGSTVKAVLLAADAALYAAKQAGRDRVMVAEQNTLLFE